METDTRTSKLLSTINYHIKRHVVHRT